MKINYKVVYEKLDMLFDRSSVIPLTNKDKWVIFSDLHMGDGGSTDDFKSNSDLFKRALEEHYLKRNYSLLLNGDVEELQRFSLKKIIDSWSDIYKIFDRFHEKGRLIKTIGNHDLELQVMEKNPLPYDLLDGIKFKYKNDHLFFFHGHQASKRFQKHNDLIGFTLKYFANPLRIKNYSVSHSSMKQYKIEKRAYHYSAYRKIVSIIGHTHRPLFESLNKVERLKYKIEQLCREFSEGVRVSKRDAIKESIKSYKRDLKKHYKEDEGFSLENFIYNTIFHIPCLFNSGCVIGKRGMTCLEIEQGEIRLVHWFDEKISKKYLLKTGYEPQKLKGSDYYRMVINQETLDYVFTRINFLS